MEKDVAVMPPEKVFLNLKRPLEEVRVWDKLYGFKGFTYPEKGGIESNYHGRPHPLPLMLYPEAVEANNVMKRFTIGMVKMLKPQRHWTLNALTQYHRLASYQYYFHYLHIRYYNDCSRELMGFIYRLLRHLGFSFNLSYELGRDGATLLQYENGYLHRVQDLFTEMTKESLLANPRKELKRIGELYSQRENYKGEGVETSFRMVIAGLRFLLLIPKFKKAFKFALIDSEFKNFQFDEKSKYWADRFDAYDFGGETYNIRQLKQGFKLYG